MIIRKIVGFILTAVIFAAAILIGHALWVHYMDEPWTRDGRVRADVINVAPDVSGAVVTMPVADNQSVKKGDLLMEILQEGPGPLPHFDGERDGRGLRGGRRPGLVREEIEQGLDLRGQAPDFGVLPLAAPELDDQADARAVAVVDLGGIDPDAPGFLPLEAVEGLTPEGAGAFGVQASAEDEEEGVPLFAEFQSSLAGHGRSPNTCFLYRRWRFDPGQFIRVS
jgi:hypothetical protein